MKILKNKSYFYLKRSNKKKFLLVFLAIILIIFCTPLSNYIYGVFIKIKDNYVFKDTNEFELQIPILNYHYISPYGSDYEDGLSVHAEDFEMEMKYLYDNGYKTVTMNELLDWKKGKIELTSKNFLITFDDAFSSTYFLAEQILKKYDFTATMFVINSVTQDITIDYNESKYEYSGWDKINSSSRDVIDIGSHSFSMHKQKEKKAIINSLSYKQIYQDVLKSKEQLNTKFFAYPYGAYTDDAKLALKDAGYDLAFKLSGKMTYRGEDQYEISRINVPLDYDDFKDIFETNERKRVNLKLI